MENPHIESLSLRGTFYDNILSVGISSLSIILAVTWIVARLWNGKLPYRPGVFEFGIGVFAVGCIISTIAASNRRAGITDSITILSSMMTAFVLGQIADTNARKKLLLFAIIAIGTANVYQCSEQFFSSNKFLIEEYEQAPGIQLEQIGIEPGSFEHMLYEHRLYSKDVRGFFTTGNSTASFFVLVTFCIFACFDFKSSIKKLWIPAVLVLIFLFGLFETHSKGAIASFIIGIILLFLTVRFGSVLRQRQVLIISAIIILAVIGTAFVVNYGIKHETLPGGNSMLVRWQYWSAAVKIIRDNLWTGVGGGNFGAYYTQYKIPQAIETVRDPHNFILNIAAQYGIIGLAGFCTAIFWPIIKICRQGKLSVKSESEENRITEIITNCGILAVLVLLFIRPAFARTALGSGEINSTYIFAIMYIITTMYLVPAFCFGIIFRLCTKNPEQLRNHQLNNGAILCGLIAMLIHNLIDFAIFEPGIMTAFWVCAAIVYTDYRTENTVSSQAAPTKLKKTVLAAGAIAVATLLLWFCIIPGAKAAIKTERANQLFEKGEIEEATALLISANRDDGLNPTPGALAGEMFIHKFKKTPKNSPQVLLRAEKVLLAAIRRDRTDYNNYKNLAEVYRIMAQINSSERAVWSEKALAYFQKALVYNPSSANLHAEFANIARQQNKIALAIEHYEKAIEIEDAFREQFRIMYPDRDVFSKMGNINYINAKEKLEELIRMRQKQ
ncbi:MAG: O-antigen ligase family protein [Sedimentisphaerales bacterium]|nr:O-antigen ligase family protein [Sedimentisphaerales bacterium]